MCTHTNVHPLVLHIISMLKMVQYLLANTFPQGYDNYKGFQWLHFVLIVQKRRNTEPEANTSPRAIRTKPMPCSLMIYQSNKEPENCWNSLSSYFSGGTGQQLGFQCLESWNLANSCVPCGVCILNHANSQLLRRTRALNDIAILSFKKKKAFIPKNTQPWSAALFSTTPHHWTSCLTWNKPQPQRKSSSFEEVDPHLCLLEMSRS